MTSTINIFTSPTCPNCPPAVKLAKEVAQEREDTKVIEISTVTTIGQQLARKYEIMAVPTLLVGGPSNSQKIGLRGTPSKKDLIKAVEISLGLSQWEEKEKKQGIMSKMLKKFKMKI